MSQNTNAEPLGAREAARSGAPAAGAVTAPACSGARVAAASLVSCDRGVRARGAARCDGSAGQEAPSSRRAAAPACADPRLRPAVRRTPGRQDLDCEGPARQGEEQPERPVDVIIQSAGGTQRRRQGVKWLAQVFATKAAIRTTAQPRSTSSAAIGVRCRPSGSRSSRRSRASSSRRTRSCRCPAASTLDVEPALAVRVGQREHLARRPDARTPARRRRSRSSTPAIQNRADFGNRVDRERQPLDDRRQHVDRRPARSRHVRRRHRGGRGAGPGGCRSGAHRSSRSR